tara:strand:+ start:748 stop:1245 length:498 start_codon:yes stop_codon:yes gene_type:complete
MSKTQDTSATTSSDETVFDGSRWLGRVKWFNNRAGFGFITVLEGEKKGEDVFTHHSGISVDTEQYKYLVQGEYVTFELRSSDNTEHPYQAGNVKGVLEGMLMCETRTSMRKEGNSGEYERRTGRSGRGARARPRGGGPREGQEGWQMGEGRKSKGRGGSRNFSKE